MKCPWFRKECHCEPKAKQSLVALFAVLLLCAFSACTDYEAQIDNEYEAWLAEQGIVDTNENLSGLVEPPSDLKNDLLNSESCVTFIALKSPLADETLALINSANQPVILVMRQEVDASTMVKTINVYGYYITQILLSSQDNESAVYKLSGVLHDENGNVAKVSQIVGSDLLAFNFPYDPGYVLSDEFNRQKADYLAQGFDENVWNKLIAWTKKINFRVQNNLGESVERFPDYEEWGSANFIGSLDGSECKAYASLMI